MGASATAANGRFAPIERGSYLETVTQVRDDGSGVERFTIDRTLVFTRAEDGWIATVTFGPVQLSAATGAAGLLQRATAALAGTAIRFRLTDRGEITEIIDQAAQWRRFVATVAAMGGGDEAKSHDAAAIADALLGLPRDQQRDILVEPVAVVMASAEAERGAQPATRASVLARSALGAQGDIPGTTSAIETINSIRTVTDAEGIVGSGGAAAGHVRLRRSREVDKTTGLLRESREEIVTDAVIDGKPARQSITNTTTLTLLVS